MGGGGGNSTDDGSCGGSSTDGGSCGGYSSGRDPDQQIQLRKTKPASI